MDHGNMDGKTGEFAVLDANKDFIASASQWRDSAEMDKRAEEWRKGKMDAMMPNMMKIGTAGQQCASDPEFIEAMKPLDDLK